MLSFNLSLTKKINKLMIIKYLAMKNKLFILLIIALAIVQSSYAQITISGKVTDTYGEAIPGVNVMVKGISHIGTITNLEGQYSLEVPDSTSVLVFSFVGMKSQEEKITGRTYIETMLENDDVGIDEVVVTALGVSRVKKMLSYSVASVISEEIKNKSPKTWKRSNKSINAVKLSVGDDEDNETVPLLGTEMKLTIDGFRARVVLNYYFYSECSNYEGTFKIRLPSGASPYYFAFGPTVYLDKEYKNDNFSLSFNEYYEDDSVYLNNNRIEESKTDLCKQPNEAKVVPSSKAAFAYAETVKGNIDPMLAEWGGADIFNCRVFPIESNQMHRVVIAYDVNLTNIGSDKLFNLSIPKTESTTIVDIDIAELNDTKTIISYTKGLKKENGRYKIHIENPETEEISIRYTKPENILLVDKQDKYFAASLTVNLPQTKKESFSSDAIFMLDISASSNPDKFNVWLKLLKAILNNNQKTIKRFNVLFFNIETFWNSKHYIKNTPENVNKLLNYCNRLSLEGATDIGAAITEASHPNWDKGNNKKNIFLLSDGSITWGEEELYSISAEIDSKSRIFVYNTGISGTDMNMLEQLARESGGLLFSVSGEDELNTASKAFNYETWKISSLKLAGGNDLLIEGRPRYLYPGQKIIVAGKGNIKTNSKLILNLANNNKHKKLQYRFNEQLVSALAKRVYGQIAVNQLESFDFITDKYSIPYAVHYKVPGKTCSMLMLESEADYKQYNIRLKEDSTIVKENPVNVLVKNAVKEMNESDGLAKDKLIKQLSELTSIDLEKSNSLKILIEHIPADKFRIKPSQFTCKHHLKSELSDSVLVVLKEENPNYRIIENEADILAEKFRNYDALKILSTIVEQNPSNAKLLMDVAYSAMRMGLDEHAYYLFKKVTQKRPELPHAYHTIAQILADMGQYDLAMVYYEIIFSTNWDSRFGDFKEIADLDYLRFLKSIKKSKAKLSSAKYAAKRLKYLENYFKGEIELDSIRLMITINWNTDNSDIDLHVIEPSGEECFYKHDRTKSGGWISDDVTDGYGTEMYINPSKNKGTYKVRGKYFSDDDSRASTRTQVYVVIYKNWGKTNEQVIRKVISLKDEEEMQDIIELVVD